MEQVNIQGVELHPLKHITVLKGDILHALKSTDDGYAGFGEAYFSQIESGAVKGWKRHNRMTLNIIVPLGKIKFVVFDGRENSLTYGKFQEIILSPEDNYQRLTLAPGLWMAFQGMDDKISMLMDIIPEPHDPNEADRKNIEEIEYIF